MKSLLGEVAKKVVSAILPHRCIVCEEILGDNPGLCSPCWSAVRFIENPHCSKCGVPFEYDMGDSGLCGRCIEKDPAYDRARSLFVYDDHSKKMVLKFKHGDATHSAKVFADWIIKKHEKITSSGEVIIPVPIHWSRLFMRTYNQANILAGEIGAKIPHLSYLPEGLMRIRRTKSQGHMSKEMRKANLKGSIIPNPKNTDKIQDKKVILIDDVVTSGITIEECVKALKKAGAKSVDVITLAVVVRS